MMETLSILGTTFRIIAVLAALALSTPAIAQSMVELPAEAKSADAPPIDELIEGVGTVAYAAVPIYTDASRSSKLIRYAIPGEKVNITGRNDGWFSVQLYNGRYGFIEKRNLKIVKVFYDESVTTNYMDKRLNVELRELSARFNDTLRASIYLNKYQVAPRLVMVDSAKRNNIITITMEYSAISNAGVIIPSRQQNDLQQQVQDFVELLFKKMLTAMADSYVIVIRKPMFSGKGQVLNTQGVYAQLTLSGEDIDPERLNRKVAAENRLLTQVKSTVEMDELFEEFPY